jgi:hypothetical protein
MVKMDENLRVFKNKWFAKFAKKEGISSEKLLKAIKEVEYGKIDADYGGGVIKQRIARPKDGKSGGYRSVILYRRNAIAFFVYGFSKNTMDNIDKSAVRDFKKLAKLMLKLTDEQIKVLLEKGELEEVKDEKEQDL